MEATIEELLASPYWIVDILPKRVPENSPGQYFAVERYYLKEPQLSAIKQRHVDLILKLNCYRHISLGPEPVAEPSPEEIAEAVKHRFTCLLLDGSMIVSEPDGLYLTVYRPDEPLLRLLKTLCGGEGLYLWKPRAAKTSDA